MTPLEFSFSSIAYNLVIISLLCAHQHKYSLKPSIKMRKQLFNKHTLESLSNSYHWRTQFHLFL